MGVGWVEKPSERSTGECRVSCLKSAYGLSGFDEIVLRDARNTFVLETVSYVVAV